MHTEVIQQHVNGIRNDLKRARFQEALDKLEAFGEQIGDPGLNQQILHLYARFSNEFKDILLGLKSDRADLNSIILSMTSLLNEAKDLAAEKFQTKPAFSTQGDLIEKIALGSTKFHEAVKGLMLQQADKDQLLDTISRLEEEIGSAQGKRLLWIDDLPHKIIGERRLLRSLGLEIVTSNSRDRILAIIEQDGDFDLILSDIQWKEPDFRVTYGGLDTVKAIREKYHSVFIGKLKAIFYTGYQQEQIAVIDRQTGIRSLENSAIVFSVTELVREVFTTLADPQYNRVGLSGRKTPT